MAHRVSYLWTYQSSRLGGWSENFWNTTNDVNEVERRARALLDLLRDIHTPGAYPAQFRLTQVSSTGGPIQGGLSRIVETGFGPDPAVKGSAGDGDYITTALLLFLADDTGRNSRQWITGIFDNIISSDGRYNVTPGFAPRVAALVAGLVDGSQGWSVRKANLADWPRKPITGFDPMTGIVTSPAHGIPDQALVKLGRTRPYTILSSRLWNVSLLSSDTFKLQGWSPSASIGPFQSRPFVRNQVSSLTQVTKSLILRSTSHRRGRPLGQYSGRRKTRK